MNSQAYLRQPADSAAWLSSWLLAHPQGAVLVLVAEASRQLFSDVLAENIQDKVFAAAFPAVIANSGFESEGVVLLGMTQMPRWSVLRDVTQDATLAAQTLAECVGDVDGDRLFLFCDAMLPNIASFLDALYAQLGDAVSYSGVNAGSETFQPMPCLLVNGEWISGAMLALLLPNRDKLVLAHHYQLPQHALMATGVTGNHIQSIDWRPAFEVYAELLAQVSDQQVTRDNFYQLAVHFPFGILRADGDTLIRIPVALGDDGSLWCVGEIPENALLTVVKAVDVGSLQTVDALAQVSRLVSAEHCLLTFYCAGRRMHLAAAADDELMALIARVSPVPVFGALSLGEIGSSEGGYPLFHNAVVMGMPW